MAFRRKYSFIKDIVKFFVLFFCLMFLFVAVFEKKSIESFEGTDKKTFFDIEKSEEINSKNNEENKRFDQLYANHLNKVKNSNNNRLDHHAKGIDNSAELERAFNANLDRFGINSGEINNQLEKSKQVVSKNIIHHNYKDFYSILDEHNLPTEEKFRRREKFLLENCKKYNVTHDPLETAHPEFLKNILVDKKHKLLYCNVQKMASKEWFKIWLQLIGVKRKNLLKELKKLTRFLPYITRFSNLTLSEQKEAIQTYTKFMPVREPFERLVSTYKSKIPTVNPQKPKFYVDLERKLLTNYYKLKQFKPLIKNDTTAPEGRAKFYQFVQFIISTNVSRVPRYEQGWETMTNFCMPCLFKYNIIGRMETIEEDSNYVLDRIGMKSIRFPKYKVPTSVGVTDKYYKTIPTKILKELYEIYEQDFKLFGYNPSRTLNLNNGL